MWKLIIGRKKVKGATTSRKMGEGSSGCSAIQMRWGVSFFILDLEAKRCCFAFPKGKGLLNGCATLA